MQGKDLAIILIIAHKEILSENEKASLVQCYKILNKYPIKLICPKNLNVSEYKKVNPDIQIEFIDPKWQSTYEMFNLLKMDLLLYKKFKNYQFILFYELDAWVFRDELEYWCNMGFDYIGAPWFEGLNEANQFSKIIGVGNGGFSLRNIKNFIKLYKRLKIFEVLNKYKNFNWKGIIPRLPILFYRLFKSSQRLPNCITYNNIQEDMFWCITAQNKLNSFKSENQLIKLLAKYLIKNNFKIADIDLATKFSFENNPQELYRMNNNDLPFGCHAWENYNPDFWKPFIPAIQIKSAHA